MTYITEILYCSKIIFVLITGKCWFVDDHLFLMDFGRYGIKFINDYVLITIVIEMLLREFGPYGMIHMTRNVHCFRFSRHS
jgi:hypothetical protein